MSDLTPEISPEVIAAAQEGAEETAGALSRCLDSEIQVEVGEAASFAPDAAPDGFDGPGLAVLLKFGDVGFVALLPESSGILPDWYSDPDPTGESKLSTLAQELSMLVIPETLMAEDFQAKRVSNLGEAISSGGVAQDASLATLKLTSGEKEAQLSLIWPLAAPDALYPADEPEVEAPAPVESAAPTATPHTISNVPLDPYDFSILPPYSRSLLKIRMSVQVILASKRETLENVSELTPGTILKFEKACDELLHLQVGNQIVAEGEAVKVGDKFGFRLSSMLMPDEHFKKVERSPKAS